MFKVGDRVKIKYISIYILQAYENNGNGEGIIIGIKDNGKFRIQILWDNGTQNSYPEDDIEFIDDNDNDIVKIKWYKKNKYV